MSLNDLIQTTRPPVNEIISRFRDDVYFVDNSFQRRLVWTEKQRVRLIETVLTGRPMPEIYLWQQPVDTETGAQRHSVVDGQQRINALVQFVSNEWPLYRKFLDTENQASSFAEKNWRDLSADEKGLIWNYVINVRTVPQTVTKEDIRNIFKRLNETDRSLNPQELRNAEFNGQFIEASETVANDPHWRQWEVFSDTQIRRMHDIQLASSLLTFLRRGVINDSAAVINKIYDFYNDKYEERAEDVTTVTAFLSRAEETYFQAPSVRSMFTKPIQLYTLFCVDQLAGLQGETAAQAAAGLAQFVEAYEAGDTDVRIESYREGSSSRTASKASRDRRINSLLDYLGFTAGDRNDGSRT